jgi:hypothetical protein
MAIGERTLSWISSTTRVTRASSTLEKKIGVLHNLKGSADSYGSIFGSVREKWFWRFYSELF